MLLDLTTASTSADVTATQSSMPSRTVPQPPKKPPRKEKTYEKPQGPHVKDEAIYSQSTKKSIRFLLEVKNLKVWTIMFYSTVYQLILAWKQKIPFIIFG